MTYESGHLRAGGGLGLQTPQPREHVCWHCREAFTGTPGQRYCKPACSASAKAKRDKARANARRGR